MFLKASQSLNPLNAAYYVFYLIWNELAENGMCNQFPFPPQSREAQSIVFQKFKVAS